MTIKKTPMASKVRIQRRLNRIAKDWCSDLMLFSWSGKLVLIDLVRLEEAHNSEIGCGARLCVRSNEEMHVAIFCDIPGIYNDGGCP